MKKALCLFMVLVVVTSVFFYGTEKHFSLEKYINDITHGFAEIPTFQDVADRWRTAERLGIAYIYVPLYTIVDNGDGAELGYVKDLPTAYFPDYSLMEEYEYEWRTMYDINGQPIINYYELEHGGTHSTEWPMITDMDQFRPYYDSVPDAGVINHVYGFFQRLGDSIRLIARMVTMFFENLNLFLPWNAAVED